MNTEHQEAEVKFYLTNPQGLEDRLVKLGASLAHARVHEINLRFDTPTGDLTREHRVLRLRRDEGARLTFKGPARPGEAVSVRTEIEVSVSNFDDARAILEALGYRVSILYEKYRTTYLWKDVEVTLDETPYGFFAEIEGRDATAIRKAAGELGLDWEARCLESYLFLFNRLRENLNLPASNLSFADLNGRIFWPGDLGVRPADKR